MAATIEPVADAPELNGPQPVDVFIRRALAENRTVQAAYHNVQSLEQRIPQVTTLDDPVASNAVFPIPSVAPQYFLMGYNPYNLTLAQQFPWFGTLRLRGEAAQRDVQVALAELAAAQLDTVAAVKRAYYSLHASLKTEEILTENRKILEDFRAIARQRLKTGGTQQDVLRVRDPDQRAGPRAWRTTSRGSRRRGRRWPGRSTSAPDAALDRCPTSRWRPSRPRSTAQSPGRRGSTRADRAAWPLSPATRRPSSWPASGSTRTSRWA